MSHRNTTRRSSLWLTLFLLLSLFPLSAHALDLYFAEMEVIEGTNYVIKGNTPPDKYYTGYLVCSDTTLKTLPKTTTLTTTLLRSTGRVDIEVTHDTHSYGSTDWVYNASSGLYTIRLKIDSFGRLRNYNFDMPDAGSAETNLRTASHSFKFEIAGGVPESNTKNNIVHSPSFDYTVFSGNLFYNTKNYGISSLTPATSDMCTGDTYLSAIEGNWDAAWWDNNFALDGLCTNSHSNKDGYSTDLTVLRDLAVTVHPTFGGNRWSIKGQTPGSRSLSSMQIECDGSPPANITLDTSLQSSAMQDDYEIAAFSETLTPTWLEDSVNGRYYFILGQTDYLLPDDGPTVDDLQTGLHSFVSTIDALGDTTSDNNQGSVEFNFTVYSGLLYFNDVETTFSSISFGSFFSCWDGSIFRLHLSSVGGSWSDVFGTEAMNASDICADTANNPDGYSRDLQTYSGSVDFGTLSATISGLDIEFYSNTLDATGGSFSSAVLTLPEAISLHEEDGGIISPAGSPIMNFSGDTFSQSMDELTLIVPSGPYLHSYGLPFYIRGDGFRFPLDGSANMDFVNPFPVYVHTEAINALAPEDLRSSFPSNDIIFQKPLNANNQITFDQNGLDGHLDFRQETTLTLETSFPRARIGFRDWRLMLSKGNISTSNIIGPVIAMRFGRDCHNAECAGSLAGSGWYLVNAEQAGITPSGSFGAQFSELGPTRNQKLNDTGSDSVAWGDFQVDIPGTYVRHDRGRQGAFVVSGFIMQGTSDKLASPLRLGQILLGSYDFKDPYQPDKFSPLHHPPTPQATVGDGMFAGINLGPEIYTTLSEGVGQLLKKDTLIRFFDANNPNPQIPMKDQDAVSGSRTSLNRSNSGNS